MKCLYCGEPFTPKRKNQKYDTTECSKRASNDKTKARYHSNKEVKEKICAGCGSKLSKYNDTDLCALCIAKNRNGSKIDFGNIAWE